MNLNTAGKFCALESTTEVDCVRRAGPVEEDRSHDEVDLSGPRFVVPGPSKTAGRVDTSHWSTALQILSPHWWNLTMLSPKQHTSSVPFCVLLCYDKRRVQYVQT